MVSKFVVPIFLTVIIGTCLAIQPIFNTTVAKYTGSMWYAALCSLSVSITLVLFICFMSDRFETLRHGGAAGIPKVFILAGICGILILAFTVVCITRLGPVLTASLTVTVQMIVATITAHYGWFGLEQEPINILKIIGIIFLIAGVVLVKLSIK